MADEGPKVEVYFVLQHRANGMFVAASGGTTGFLSQAMRFTSKHDAQASSQVGRYKGYAVWSVCVTGAPVEE